MSTQTIMKNVDIVDIMNEDEIKCCDGCWNMKTECSRVWVLSDMANGWSFKEEMVECGSSGILRMKRTVV